MGAAILENTDFCRICDVFGFFCSEQVRIKHEESRGIMAALVFILTRWPMATCSVGSHRILKWDKMSPAVRYLEQFMKDMGKKMVGHCVPRLCIYCVKFLKYVSNGTRTPPRSITENGNPCYRILHPIEPKCLTLHFVVTS